MSAWEDQMAASHDRAQREADPSGVSLKALAQFRRADELDAEAAYCDHRASGPGYYVDLLRGVAADRVVMAQRLRTGNGATW